MESRTLAFRGLLVKGGLQDAFRKRRAYSRDSISLDWKPFTETSPSWRVESHKQCPLPRAPFKVRLRNNGLTASSKIFKSERRMVRFLLSHAPSKPKLASFFGSPPLP